MNVFSVIAHGADVGIQCSDRASMRLKVGSLCLAEGSSMLKIAYREGFKLKICYPLIKRASLSVAQMTGNEETYRALRGSFLLFEGREGIKAVFDKVIYRPSAQMLSWARTVFLEGENASSEAQAQGSQENMQRLQEEAQNLEPVPQEEIQNPERQENIQDIRRTMEYLFYLYGEVLSFRLAVGLPEAEEIPEFFLANPNLRRNKCFLSNRLIRHVLKLRDRRFPRFLFEKKAVEDWIREKPNEVPAGWPEDVLPLPIRQDYFIQDRARQRNIDEALRLISRNSQRFLTEALNRNPILSHPEFSTIMDSLEAPIKLSRGMQLTEIPEILYDRQEFRDFTCFITDKPIRYPVRLCSEDLPLLIERSEAEKWIEESPEELPEDCPLLIRSSYFRADRETQYFIDKSLERISQESLESLRNAWNRLFPSGNRGV